MSFIQGFCNNINLFPVATFRHCHYQKELFLSQTSANYLLRHNLLLRFLSFSQRSISFACSAFYPQRRCWLNASLENFLFAHPVYNVALSSPCSSNTLRSADLDSPAASKTVPVPQWALYIKLIVNVAIVMLRNFCRLAERERFRVIVFRKRMSWRY